MIFAYHFSEAVIFYVARLQHISNEMDGVGVVLVLFNQVEHLL